MSERVRLADIVTSLACVLACGVAAYIWFDTPDRPATRSAAVTPPVNATVAPTVTPQAAVRTPAQAPASDTPGERHSKLLANTTPEAAFDAYKVLSACAEQQQHIARVETSFPVAAENQQLRDAFAAQRKAAGDLCVGLTASQVAQRIALVDRAAEALVPGAASARLAEGPFGDLSALYTRADDPLVVE